MWACSVASPQTSFGVRLSRIHFIWGRNERVTNEPQRTSAGRLRVVLPVDTKQSYTITFECVINIFIISAVYPLSSVCDLSVNNSSLPWLQLVQFGEAVNVNEYTAITKFLMIPLRFAEIILALSISFLCRKCIGTHGGKNSDKKYLSQFVFSGMTLMDIIFFTDTGATGLVLDLYF